MVSHTCKSQYLGVLGQKKTAGLHSKAFPKDGEGAALQARAGKLSIHHTHHPRLSDYGDGRVAFCGWLGFCFYGSSV